MHSLQVLLRLLPLLLRANRRRSKQLLLLVQQPHWQVMPSTSPLTSRLQLPVLLHKLRARP